MSVYICAICAEQVQASGVIAHWRGHHTPEDLAAGGAGTAVSRSANRYIDVFCPNCDKKFVGVNSDHLRRHMNVCGPISDLERLSRTDTVEDAQIIVIDPKTMEAITCAPGTPQAPPSQSHSWLLRTRFQ